MKTTEKSDSNFCEKTNVEKVFECDICTYKSSSENGIKIYKAKNTLILVDAVTEYLQIKLTIPFILQNGTVHMTTIIPQCDEYNSPQDSLLHSLMNPLIDFLLVSPEAQCSE